MFILYRSLTNNRYRLLKCYRTKVSTIIRMLKDYTNVPNDSIYKFRMINKKNIEKKLPEQLYLSNIDEYCISKIEITYESYSKLCDKINKSRGI